MSESCRARVRGVRPGPDVKGQAGQHAGLSADSSLSVSPKRGRGTQKLVLGRKICFRIQRLHPFSSFEVKHCTGRKWEGRCGRPWEMESAVTPGGSVLGTLSIDHAAQLSSLSGSARDPCHIVTKDDQLLTNIMN